MESRVKFLGHPVHQQLVVIPLGLLVMGAVFDIVYMAGASRVFAIVSFWDIVVGVVAALVAAVFGAVDWLAIPRGTRAKRVGALHGAGNVLVVLAFIISLLIRRDRDDHVPTTLALALEIGGLVLGTVTAWLGGELVVRHGVGVARAANLNAPSSLHRDDQPPRRDEHVIPLGPSQPAES